MDREWKLGEDLSTYDNLLDGLTFDDLILAVHCNCRVITPAAVLKEFDNIMQSRMQDVKFLLDNNMKEIIAEARKGRG